MAGLTQFPKFEVHSEQSSVGLRWNKYVAKLENLFVGLNIESKKRRKALLLHYSGDEVFEIYETLDLGGDESNFDAVKTSLSQYFNPKKNREFERYEFRNLKQMKHDSIDQFVPRLRQKAENCEFGDKDGEIKSQIIQGCSSKKLRLKCLEQDKPLDDILIMARTMEIANLQSQAMDKNECNDDTVNKVKQRRSQNRDYVKQNPVQPVRRSQLTCRNCGGNYPHEDKCPAFGASCNYCKKKTHFISVCRKRINSSQLREISERINENESETESTSSDSDLAFGIKSVNRIASSKVPRVDLIINGVQTKFLVDTGSSLNVVVESFIKNMQPQPELQKSETKAFAFGQSKPLTILGKYTCTVETSSKFATADFHVIKEPSENLISYETAVQLGLVPVIKSVSSEDTRYETSYEKYKPVFEGLGKLTNKQIKFHIDETVIPTAQPARRIPFHVREQVEKELERLEQLDVIEKATGATPWVSNLVVAPKPKSPNEIRLCVDMRKANQALKRERHVVPTIDDIISQVNASTVFSKVDLRQGFHQLELSEDSRTMTVFASHTGLWRYKRLNFGVSVAPEIFQNEIRQLLVGLTGVLNISDDIIIHGRTREEHDINLEATLQRLQDRNLTLNKQKCEFGKTKMKFYGYIFSESGISPDPDKIASIKDVQKPTNQSEVRSFLGMTNHVSRFIENYSTISEPLRRLTQQKQPFIWEKQQENAFNQLRNALVNDQVMTYFDPAKQTELWVDASPVGVSGILIQESKIVAYRSRSLTAVEQRYSQTEREALACVWGCQHFHLYLFGKEFTLISDHNCLESVFNNTKQIQSARLERWRLKLTTYDFKVKYRPGNQMIADYCSRHPVNKVSSANRSSANIAEDYVSFIGHTLKHGLA